MVDFLGTGIIVAALKHEETIASLSEVLKMSASTGQQGGCCVCRSRRGHFGYLLKGPAFSDVYFTPRLKLSNLKRSFTRKGF